MKARRRPKGSMNKTEARFMAEVLEPGLHGGAFEWFGYERITLKLADNCRYTPDFAAVAGPDCDSAERGELMFYEVKGHWRDDARVKIKAAASVIPAVFVAVQLKRGQWEYEQFYAAD